MKEAGVHFEGLLDYLKRSRGFDFLGYKRPNIMRRISKRMEMISVGDPGVYMDYLEVHPDEFRHLFNHILINVTGFFRDPLCWEYLAKTALPKLISEKGGDDPIRVWTAGCASGEEAYSLAMLLAEAMGLDAFKQRVKIYASDVDEEALAQARQAAYSDKAIQAVPAGLRNKYFEVIDGRYVFDSELRRTVICGRHDLLQDAPISRLDLLVCRNTLMYFNAEAQSRVLARLHFALNDRALLFLGRAEMLLSPGDLFKPIDLKNRIFEKMPHAAQRDRMLALNLANHAEIGFNPGRKGVLGEAAFEASDAAQLAVDVNGNLFMVNHLARAMFGLEARDLSRPLKDLEVSYQPLELRSLIERAYMERRPIRVPDVPRRVEGKEPQVLEVVVKPLYGLDGISLGVTIAFHDVTDPHALRKQLVSLQQELATVTEELQSANEELETTNEELQSTNEELETTNEELQSSNEELETMNEELQSTNEELQTVNEELRHRTGEINTANSFLKSILSSVHVGVAVLDSGFHVLIWNHRCEDLWGLRADEVDGRSFLNLDIGLPIDQLTKPMRACLAGERDGQTSEHKAVNRRGKPFTCRVACAPLLNKRKEREGVILTMEEVGS